MFGVFPFGEDRKSNNSVLIAMTNLFLAIHLLPNREIWVGYFMLDDEICHMKQCPI